MKISKAKKTNFILQKDEKYTLEEQYSFIKVFLLFREYNIIPLVDQQQSLLDTRANCIKIYPESININVCWYPTVVLREFFSTQVEYVVYVSDLMYSIKNNQPYPSISSKIFYE